MSRFNTLMLSASKAGDTGYLDHTKPFIRDHLNGISDIVFIPYAGVSINFDAYTERVANALPNLTIRGIHTFSDPIKAIRSAQAILVGGGNTFALLNRLYENQILEPLQQKIASGVPYIGWSAGSIICGATIRTTNDMPIIEPKSFDSLAILPFQLNPHYANYITPGHNGETRDERLQEFTQLHPHTPVLGFQEGTALELKGELKGQTLRLLGTLPAYLFLGNTKTEIAPQADLSYLLSKDYRPLDAALY